MTARRMDLHFDSLRDAISEVERLHQSGWERAGTWSLGQILDHLNITLRFTFGEIPFFLPPPLRPVVKFFFWPTVVKGLPIRLKGVAPKPIQPRPEPDEREMVQTFVELVERHFDESIPFAPIHPVFGRLDREGWLLVHQWHVTHHLSFMVPAAEKQ